MVSKLPKFRPKVDTNISYQHMADFGVEIFQYTNENKIRSRHVNVFHVSTDLNNGKQEINKISQFLKYEGYDVKYQQHPKSWHDVDVLIIGSDKAHLDNVDYIIRTVLKMGIMPHWDVLCYGIGYDPSSVLPFEDQVLYSSSSFSTHGIYITFAHVRRRDDSITLMGLQAHMMRAIEKDMDDILQTGAKHFDEKKKLLRDKIKNDGNWNSDAEIFFAVINVLQKIRNMAIHLSDSAEHRRNIEIWTQHLVYFCNTAEKHGYKVTSDFTGSFTKADIHKHFKWQISIGRAAIEWLDSYKDVTISKMKS